MAYPLALPNASGPVFVLDKAQLSCGVAASRESPRGRIVLPVHRTATEGVQRMFNFIQRGSYARPHHHPAVENIETVVCIQGVVGFLTFEADGRIATAHRLQAGDAASCMVDIEPAVWHTVVPIGEDNVILEIKRGPYNAATDKNFAEWAPKEGEPSSAAYLDSLVSAVLREAPGPDIARR